MAGPRRPPIALLEGRACHRAAPVLPHAAHRAAAPQARSARRIRRCRSARRPCRRRAAPACACSVTRRPARCRRSRPWTGCSTAAWGSRPARRPRCSRARSSPHRTTARRSARHRAGCANQGRHGLMCSGLDARGSGYPTHSGYQVPLEGIPTCAAVGTERARRPGAATASAPAHADQERLRCPRSGELLPPRPRSARRHPLVAE